MESQPQNPEFRNNPEIFHPCIYSSLHAGHLCMLFEKNIVNWSF